MKNKKGIKFIANVLSWTMFSLLILIGTLLLYYTITARIYAKKGQAYEPPFSLYTIISGSMEKELMVYDVVLNFKVTDPDQIKPGDIITFTSTSPLNPGMTVTHRVLETVYSDGGISYRTKGDNNKTADASAVPFGMVKSKVFMKIPQLGRIQFLIASKGGWLFVVLLPALGVIIYDVIKLVKLLRVKNKIKEPNSESPIDKNKEKKEQLRKEELREKLLNQKKIIDTEVNNSEEKENQKVFEDDSFDDVIREKVRKKYGSISDEQLDKLVNIIKQKNDE